MGEDMQLSNLTDRHRFRPSGILGGADGPLGETLLDPDTPQERRIHSKGTYEVPNGTVMSTRLSGAGGYGDPHERDPVLVARDVRHGLIDSGVARTVYAVVIGSDGEVDEAATAQLRAGAR